MEFRLLQLRLTRLVVLALVLAYCFAAYRVLQVSCGLCGDYAVVAFDVLRVETYRC